MDSQIITRQALSFKVAEEVVDEFELEFGCHRVGNLETIAMWKHYGANPQTAIDLQISHDIWYTNLRAGWDRGLRDRELILATNAAYTAAYAAQAQRDAEAQAEYDAQYDLAWEREQAEADWMREMEERWFAVEQAWDEEEYRERIEA